MIGPDFMLVELTPDGVAFAKDTPLRISNGRTSVVFLPGVPVKVAKFEWDMLLRDHSTFNGKTLFAIVPASELVPEGAPVIHMIPPPAGEFAAHGTFEKTAPATTEPSSTEPAAAVEENK
jgi:hypothetical protein